jgi:hypothetical protein
VTASGGSEYVRPVPEAYDLLLQTQGEASPTATEEAPPEPPENTPTPTEEATAPVEQTPTPTEEGVEPPAEPTSTPEPTTAVEASATPEPPGPVENAGTAIIIGTLVSADTGDPIARAQVVVLKPGISVKDWKRGNAGDDAVYTWITTDARGNFQLPDPVQRGEKYSIWLQAPGYEELFKDDKVLATEDDPAIVDLGMIKMPLQV